MDTVAKISEVQPVSASEYEREPVPSSEWKEGKSFLGMYAGEHAAGTELMIGPLFLAAGVSAFDLIIGLLIGNFLAVLSWRYITAPIATKTRITLYYQLEKICGKKLVTIYNLANGILFCFLAGSMITVSATAVGLPFNMQMPTLSDLYPASVTWVIIVVIVGVIISLVAAKGYHSVSRFANIAAPWMVLVFLACGIVALRELNVGSLREFWEIWGNGSNPFPGQMKYTFWHVVFFAWFCNAAMHIGMADLSVFRYAKKASSGWTTSAGMYIGHFMAWISASLLYAVFIQSPEAISSLENGEAPSVAPGPMAYQAVGIAGLALVLVAGWTTANPTIYRAGLAFQAILPKASTFKVTLIAGGLATIAGIFPAFAMKLLGFVAIYGFILAPVGAIIFFEYYFAEKIGITKNYAEQKKINFNWAVLLAWLTSISIFYFLADNSDMFLSFLTFPAWVSCGFLYLVLSKWIQKK